MMTKSLQTLGALGLFVWTALGVLAWARVQDHVEIVLSRNGSEDSAEQALIADQIASLSSDFDALVGALESDFELVAGAIESDGAEAVAQLARAEERLAALEASLPAALEARETAGALAQVLARLEDFDFSRTVVAAGGRSSGPDDRDFEAESDGEIEELAEPAPVAPAADSGPELAAVEEPVPAELPHRKSFLAFELPSRDFEFAGQQNFDVLSSLSRVGFDAKSTLHDFSGVSSGVSGYLQVDLARPERGITGSIRIEAESLSTGLDGRDEAMQEHLGSDSVELIEFVPTDFETTSLDVKQQQLAGRVRGKLSIHGTTRVVEMAVSAHVDESRRLVLEGGMPLLMSDYDVHVPSKLGVISVEDEVQIWIHLRARAKAGRPD